MLNITHYQRNANENHNEVQSHTGQNGCYEKGKLQANITDEHRCKNPQQNCSKHKSTTLKKNIYHDQMGFIPGM